MSSQCHHNVIAMSSQYHHNVITISSQCHHNVITMSSQCHRNIITVASQYHYTMGYSMCMDSSYKLDNLCTHAYTHMRTCTRRQS
jgi:hypothetical protein